MNRTLLIAMLLANSGMAFSAPNSLPIGTNIGYGDTSNSNTIYAPIANPSNNAPSVSNIDGYRFGTGISGNLFIKSNGFEGVKSYLNNEIDVILNKNIFSLLDGTALADAFNGFMRKYQNGYIASEGSVTIPVILNHEYLSGGISIDYSQQYAGKASLVRNSDVTGIFDPLQNTINVTKEGAGLAFQYKEMNELAVGYGWKGVIINQGSWYDGNLNFGVTARYINMNSASAAIDFVQYTEDNLYGKNRSINDYLNGIQNGVSDSNVTADIGLDWTSENFMVSLVGKNLTSPSFEVQDQSTGYNFGIRNSYVMKPKTTMGVQWYSANRNWTLASSIDFNESNDLNDNPVQWFNATVSYATNEAWYIPDVRLGVRNNMATNGYNYITAGITIGVLTMDLATTTTDFSGIQNNQSNEGVMASLGLEFDF